MLIGLTPPKTGPERDCVINCFICGTWMKYHQACETGWMIDTERPFEYHCTFCRHALIPDDGSWES